MVYAIAVRCSLKTSIEILIAGLLKVVKYNQANYLAKASQPLLQAKPPFQGRRTWRGFKEQLSLAIGRHLIDGNFTL